MASKPLNSPKILITGGGGSQVQDLMTGMRFFERPVVLIEAGRTEAVSRLLLCCVSALATLDTALLQCAPAAFAQAAAMPGG